MSNEYKPKVGDLIEVSCYNILYGNYTIWYIVKTVEKSRVCLLAKIVHDPSGKFLKRLSVIYNVGLSFFTKKDSAYNIKYISSDWNPYHETEIKNVFKIPVGTWLVETSLGEIYKVHHNNEGFYYLELHSEIKRYEVNYKPGNLYVIASIYLVESKLTKIMKPKLCKFC